MRDAPEERCQRWTAADEARLRAMSPREPAKVVAKLLGRTVGGVNWKRRKLGLPRAGVGRRIDPARFSGLYAAGLSDARIAERLGGCGETTVREYRWSLGLPPSRPGRGGRRKAMVESEAA